LAANLLIRPVDARWHMSDAELAALRAAQGKAPGDAATLARAEAAKFRLFAFWLVVLLPLGWGIWKTVQKALAMLQW
ncbi:MAG: MFS transporter, partial [Gammaproteobacteria bacterium]